MQDHPVIQMREVMGSSSDVTTFEHLPCLGIITQIGNNSDLAGAMAVIIAPIPRIARGMNSAL